MNVISDFSEWLQQLVQDGNEHFEDNVVDLSMPPSLRTKSYKSMKAYGTNFRVSSAELNLVTSDSGVTVSCETLQRSGLADRY